RARCREAQRPRLDALAHQPGHRVDVRGRGRLITRAALAHRVCADGPVRDLAADVDGEAPPFDRIEVFGVAFPAPRDAFGQRGAGNVLNALHQFDQPVLTAGAHRGETHAAVAGDQGGHAMATGRLEQAVPANLAVVVGVDVDEPRRDDAAGGIDGFRRLPLQSGFVGRAPHDLDDPAVPHADVGSVTGHTRAVNDGATDNLQIEHAATSSTNRRSITSLNYVFLQYKASRGIAQCQLRCHASCMTEADAFVDQAAMGLAEPQPMYKALRESTPVFRAPQAVVLSRLADIEMALKHTELFSSNMDAVDLGNIRP